MPILGNLRSQFETGQFGFSGSEQSLMLEKIRRQLREGSEAQIESTQTSLQRRNLLSPGQAAGISTRIASSFGKQLGGAATDIQLESAKQDRDIRYQTILPLLVQLELAEKEGRIQDKAGIFKLIGTILGTGAGFLIGGPPGAAAGGATGAVGG